MSVCLYVCLYVACCALDATGGPVFTQARMLGGHFTSLPARAGPYDVTTTEDDDPTVALDDQASGAWPRTSGKAVFASRSPRTGDNPRLGLREGTHSARGSCVSNGVLGHVTTPPRPALRAKAGRRGRTHLAHTTLHSARTGWAGGSRALGPKPNPRGGAQQRGQRGHGVRTYTLHQSPRVRPTALQSAPGACLCPTGLSVCRLSAARVVEDTTRPS